MSKKQKQNESINKTSKTYATNRKTKTNEQLRFVRGSEEKDPFERKLANPNGPNPRFLSLRFFHYASVRKYQFGGAESRNYY